MRAIHFGAGNIGRGFIGALLVESGYELVFADVNVELVERIQTSGAYTVHLAGEKQEKQVVRGVKAINSREYEAETVRLVAEADLVTAAVGAANLKFIAPVIAKGLQERSVEASPLNIIACENLIGAGDRLEKLVREQLKDGVPLEGRVAFPNAAVDRIVPEQGGGDSLDVKVEPYYEWVVNRSETVAPLPDLSGVDYVDTLAPYIERKLFTVNTGHAAAAYLGYHYGKATIDEALKDRRVRPVVEQALQETGRLLASKHGFSEAELAAYRRSILKRFENPHITDDVTRVGRAPIRKLGADDRLVGPAAQLTERFAVPEALVKVIAAALAFDASNDPEAVELQTTLSTEGVEGALCRYANLDGHHPLVAPVCNAYANFIKNREDL
ncbi:MAG TPA: mannitol-1-phosphate 5-dehydrogenase [Bacillales bacterium]|nr:mannitol-1-phosphate 5-dehydrogenase [Bacillales bacterium]